MHYYQRTWSFGQGGNESTLGIQTKLVAKGRADRPTKRQTKRQEERSSREHRKPLGKEKAIIKRQRETDRWTKGDRKTGTEKARGKREG